MKIAVDLLAALHTKARRTRCAVETGVQYRVPRYDMDAMLIETELLLDWFPAAARRDAGRRVSRRLHCAVARALTPALTRASRQVLRDYHSPNLIWLPNARALPRIGLLDFQDAMMGPAAYDVASLLQDARVTVPSADGDFAAVALHARAWQPTPGSMRRPSRSYATFAAQRASKILGIFARLDQPRRQAAISASSAAGMDLSAAFAGASGAGAARRLVPRQYSRAESEIAQ